MRSPRSRNAPASLYVHARALGLVLTVGLVVFLCGALALTAILPRYIGPDGGSAAALVVLRWPVLWCGMLVVAATLYRVARWRMVERGRFITVGALLAAGSWLVASAGFSGFVAAAPRVASSYGSLRRRSSRSCGSGSSPRP